MAKLWTGVGSEDYPLGRGGQHPWGCSVASPATEVLLGEMSNSQTQALRACSPEPSDPCKGGGVIKRPWTLLWRKHQLCGSPTAVVRLLEGISGP